MPDTITQTGSSQLLGANPELISSALGSVGTEQNAKGLLLEDFIKRIGGLRDGVIAGAGIVYILGYIVWSYHAWRNNLGLLPTLQYQYFMAGLPLVFVSLVCAIFIVCGVWIELVGLKFRAVVDNTGNKYLPKVKRLYLAFPFIVIILLCIISPIVLKNIFGFAKSLLLCVVLWCYIKFSAGYHTDDAVDLAPLLKFSDIRRVKGWDWLRELTMNSFISNSFIVLVFSTYVTVWYPKIPQEFGGTKPRIAYFDVKRSEISMQTRASLLPEKYRELPKELSKDSTPIVRTVMLQVYYSSNEYMLVRPYGATIETPVFQVKKETVQSVTWCGYDEKRAIDGR
jgi:heme/copper-type cytochrome/quinol oxidase subunit 2